MLIEKKRLYPSQRSDDMRWLKAIIFCLLFAINTYLPGVVMAATYYVDPVYGNDGNPGTSAAPWRTIGKAESSTENGSTVFLRGGNYGQVYINRTGLNRSSWVDGVTYTAEDVSNPPVFDKLSITGPENRYLTIKNISVIAPGVIPDDPIYTYSAAVLIGDSSYIRIIDCNISGWWTYDEGKLTDTIVTVNARTAPISDILFDGCDMQGGYRGIHLYNDLRDNIVVKNNHIHKTASSIISIHSEEHHNNGEVLIENNHLYDRRKTINAHGSGITLRVSDVTIRGNIIRDYGGSGGIRFYGWPPNNYAHENILIENNLVYDSDGPTNLFFANLKDNITIRNNTFIGHDGSSGEYKYVEAVVLQKEELLTEATNIKFYNNVVIGLLTVKDGIDLMEDNNIVWAYQYQGSYVSNPPLGQNTLIIEPTGNNNYFEGSGNFFVGGALFDKYRYSHPYAHEFSITAVDANADTFGIKALGDFYEDWSTWFFVGETFVVTGSAGNDGTWTIAATPSYNSNTGITTIPVTGDITGAVAGGTIIYRNSIAFGDDGGNWELSHKQNLNDAYQLAATSDAIGFANPAYAPAIDLLGNPRDADPDAGCYEYGASSQPGCPILDHIGDKFVGEDEVLTFDVNATDPDGDPITYSIQNKPTTATFTGQTFSWTPTHSEAGPHQVTFIASDGTCQDSETITITVGYAPVLDPIPDYSITENNLLTFTVTATDTDGNPLAYSASNLPQDASFDANSQEFSWTPSYAHVGIHLVIFTVSDGVYTDSETITITVNFADTDSDGLPDAWEIQYFGNLTQGPNDNPDGDTFTNLEEYQRGTDPTIFDEVPADLVLEMRFNEGSGTQAIDSSGTGNTGTLVNGPTWTTGKIGTALSFDGIDDYVECGADSSLNLTESLSIVAWINPQSFGQGAWGRIVDKGDGSRGFSFLMDGANGGLSYVVYGGVVLDSSSNVISLNTWQHVAVVYNELSSTVTFYVDGQGAGSSSSSTSPLDSSIDPLVIGIRGHDLNRAFNGIIDDVRVYSRALSAAEILQLYNPGINHAPVLTSIGNKGVNENDLLTFTVNARDADGDTITYSAQNLPRGVVFANQTFNWTPDYTQAASYDVTFVASDGQAQDSETVTITVNNVNRAPVLAAIGPKSVDQNSTLNFSVSATDADGDTITYSAQNLPGGAVFAGQTFTWTPDYNQAASYDVTFIASDGQAQDSETITISVIIDTLAPSVTDLSPTADSIQIPLNNLVILHIVDAGKGVDANSVTITVDNNTVYSGNTTHYSSAYGHCRRTGTKADYVYIYQSDEIFDFEQNVSVTVNAIDLKGNVMNEHSYSFKTEMRSFGRNKKVVYLGKNTYPGSKSLSIGRAVTIRDNSGNIWAAWHTGLIGSRDIYVGNLTSRAEYFSSSIQLTNNTNDQDNPAIALGSSDKLYVVWQDNRRGNWDIYVSTSVDGINWSVERRVTDSNDNQINPVIVVDSSLSNNAYIVWQDDRGVGGNQDIYVAVSGNDFVTEMVSQITSDISDQVEPAIVADSNNTIYVVWTDARNGKNDIYGAASNYGPWTNVAIVSKEDSQSSPAIATEAAGSILHLLWIDDTPGDDDIFYAKTAGGLPASPLTGSSIIDDSSGADQLEPVIAVSGSTGSNLAVFACWQDERNINGVSRDTDLYFAEISSNYRTNVFVGDDGTNANQWGPAIGIDEYGYPYLVWIDDRSVYGEIYYAGNTFIEGEALSAADISIALGATVGTDYKSINRVDDISVEIPSGAYSCDMKVTISRIKNPPKITLERFSLPYEFGPSGVEFTQPVTITIPYEVSGFGSSISAYWYNPLTTTLSQEGITDVETIVISPTLHALRFKTTHFTQFLVGGIFGAAAGGGRRCLFNVP